MANVIDTKECLNCGKELVQLAKKRKKIFCNDTCRSNYWQKSDRLEKQGKTIEEIVSILEKERKTMQKKIKENNSPENKERKSVPAHDPKFETEMDRMIWEEEQKIINKKK